MRNFVRFKIFFLWPSAIVYLLWQIILFQDPTWILLGVLIYYPFHQLGFGIGGHKLFAHRSFVSARWFPYVSMLLGSICFYGNPVMGAIVHRQHHLYADTALDPHSPMHGRWHAFIGWNWSYTPPPPSAQIAADLIRDYPFLRIYEKIEWLVLPVFYTVLALVNHWLMLSCLLAAVLSFGVGMFINAFSHEPSEKDSNKAVNRKFLAKFVNPLFLHQDHHDHSSLYDYSTSEVKDFSAPFIKHFLIKRT